MKCTKDKTPTITDEGLLFKRANDDTGLQYIKALQHARHY